MINLDRYRPMLGTVLHYLILFMLALGGYFIWRTYDLNTLDQSSNFNMLSSFGNAVSDFDAQVDHIAVGGQVMPGGIESDFQDIETGLKFFSGISEQSLLKENQDYEQQLRALANTISRIEILIQDGLIASDIPRLQDLTDQLHKTVHVFTLSGLNALSTESEQWRNRSTFFLTIMIILLSTGTLVYLIFVFIMRQQSAAIQTATQMSDRANKQLRATINASLDAVIVSDMDGFILECNTAFEEIFGHDREDALGFNLSDIIVPPHLRAAHKAGLKRYKETREAKLVGQGAVAITALREDGSEFPVELLLVKGEGELGEPIMISYIRDMTTTKAAETDLQQARDAALAADKAKSRFLAIMSHEMRTPLTGIFGALDLIKKSNLTKKQSQYVDLAQASGKTLLRHVTDVLDISRIDSQQLELVQDPIDLGNFLCELEQTHTPIAQEAGNRILSTWDSITHPVVLCDSHRLRQIIVNLMINSLKFTENGLVTLSVKEVETLQDKSRYRFQIEDTGTGIPVEHQPHIFEEFYTQDQSYSRTNEGTGLGLSIVKRLVKLLGSTIDFTSVPGKGTTFWFELVLPHGQSAIVQPSKPVCSEVDFAGRRVLLVEDNSTSRLVVSALLRDMGLEVIEAANGAEAVTKAFDKALDLILMDISMPVMDGMEATAKIKATKGPNQNTPILALTAHALPQEQNAFFEAGMLACLTKPVDPALLSEALETYLDTHEHEPGQGQKNFPEITEERHAAQGFNMSVIDDLKGALGDDLFKKTSQTFLNETELAFDTMAKGIIDQDLKSVQAEAHKTLGAAGLFGADDLKISLRAVEQAAKAGNADPIPADFEAAKTAWHKTKKILSQGLEI